MSVEHFLETNRKLDVGLRHTTSWSQLLLLDIRKGVQLACFEISIFSFFAQLFASFARLKVPLSSGFQALENLLKLFVSDIKTHNRMTYSFRAAFEDEL